MALDFPAAPANGAVFSAGSKTWIYSTADGKWTASTDMLSEFLVSGGVVGLGDATYSPVTFQQSDVYIQWADAVASNYGALYFERQRGTVAAPEALAVNDRLGGLSWLGHEGTSWQEGAWLQGYAEDVSTGDVQMSLYLGTSGDKNTGTRFRVDSRGRVQIGSQTPELNTPKFQVSGSSGTTDFNGTGSVSGTVLTITAVSSGSIQVGDLVVTMGSDRVQPGTYVLSLGTGTGGTGTYNLSTSQTTASTTIRTYHPQIMPIMRLANYDSNADALGPLAGIEFWSADDTAGAGGVRAFIQAETQDTNGATDLVLGTSAASVAGANESLRIRQHTGSTPVGAAWTAYTPTLGGTGWAIGAGVITAAYCQIGKTVHFRIAITFGSGSTAGTGTFNLTLPVAPLSSSDAYLPFPLTVADNSTGNIYQGHAIWSSGSTIWGYVPGTNGLNVNITNSVPFGAWAGSDRITVHGTYEVA